MIVLLYGLGGAVGVIGGGWLGQRLYLQRKVRHCRGEFSDMTHTATCDLVPPILRPVSIHVPLAMWHNSMWAVQLHPIQAPICINPK